MAVSPIALVALGSGIPLVILGLALLAITPRKTEQVFFGIFAVLWGCQIVTANFGFVLGSVALHRVGFLVSLGLVPLAYLFLTHFSVLVTRNKQANMLTYFMGVVAISAVGTLVLDPTLVVAEVTSVGGALKTTYGPATMPLFFVPFYAAFYLTIGVLYHAYRKVEAGTRRHHYRGILLALALFTSYMTVNLLFVTFDLGGSGLLGLDRIGVLLRTVVLLSGAALIVGIITHLALSPPHPENVDLPLILAFLVPVSVALVENGLATLGYGLNSVGFWRLATVAVLVYALARRHLFDLDLRLKRIAASGVAALVVAIGLVASVMLWAGGADLFRAGTPFLVGIALAGTTLAARDQVAEWLFPGVSQEDDYLHQRKLEVYRAMLESAAIEGEPFDSPRLRRARRSLDIDDREHDIMEFMVTKNLGRHVRLDPAPEEVRVVPGALLKGRYKVDRLIGQGAHGRAHLAYDEKDDRMVVVKVVGTSLLGGRAATLLIKEARLLKKIGHPNVIRVLDALEGVHETVIVMEFADGGNLYGLLERKGQLPFDQGVDLLDGILAGLDAVHQNGIIHRDVKPENVLLMKDGTVKVADFGVARESRTDATNITGGAIGTLLYMSPEQVRGGDVDRRSDLYAAAVVFHQMTTGRFYLPIAGKDDFQVRRLILETRPQIETRHLPDWVGPFLGQALAKDPEERFPDAAAMRAHLRDAAGTGPEDPVTAADAEAPGERRKPISA